MLGTVCVWGGLCKGHPCPRGVAWQSPQGREGHSTASERSQGAALAQLPPRLPRLRQWTAGCVAGECVVAAERWGLGTSPRPPPRGSSARAGRGACVCVRSGPSVPGEPCSPGGQDTRLSWAWDSGSRGPLTRAQGASARWQALSVAAETHVGRSESLQARGQRVAAATGRAWSCSRGRPGQASWLSRVGSRPSCVLRALAPGTAVRQSCRACRRPLLAHTAASCAVAPWTLAPWTRPDVGGLTALLCLGRRSCVP